MRRRAQSAGAARLRRCGAVSTASWVGHFLCAARRRGGGAGCMLLVPCVAFFCRPMSRAAGSAFPAPAVPISTPRSVLGATRRSRWDSRESRRFQHVDLWSPWSRTQPPRRASAIRELSRRRAVLLTAIYLPFQADGACHQVPRRGRIEIADAVPYGANGVFGGDRQVATGADWPPPMA